MAGPRRPLRLRGLTGRRASALDGEGENVIDLTPMIDLTILLLIFFMVTSSLAAIAKVHLPQARHGRGIDPQSVTSIVVLEAGAAPEAPAALVETGAYASRPIALDEVDDAVQQGLAQGRTGVVVKAHRLARWRDVSPVTRRAAQVEGIKLYFGVREKD